MSTLHPFADFLENEESYLTAQQVWQDLIGRVALVHGYQPLDYLNLEQNGTPLRDGNPIAATSVAGKGIRIIQARKKETISPPGSTPSVKATPPRKGKNWLSTLN